MREGITHNRKFVCFQSSREIERFPKRFVIAELAMIRKELPVPSCTCKVPLTLKVKRETEASLTIAAGESTMSGDIITALFFLDE